MKCSPVSYYGKAKLFSTRYLLKLNKSKNKFPVCVLRFYQVYGPAQDSNRIIPYVIRNSIKNKKFACSAGNQIRDFLYIDDAINAITIIFKKIDKANGKIFNIGLGKGIKLKYVIKKINKIIGKGTPLYGSNDMRTDEAKRVLPNILLAKKLLKWRPRTTLAKGIELTIQSYIKK